MNESRIKKESSTKNYIGIKKNQECTKPELYIQEKLNEVNKLVDLTFDPEEKINLINDSGFRPIVSRLMAVVENQPIQDKLMYYN